VQDPPVRAHIQPCGVGAQTKLTMAEKSRLLECFCLEGWLVASPPGQYSIGVRNAPGEAACATVYSVPLHLPGPG